MNYSPEELRSLGLTFGHDVFVDRSCRFYGANEIHLGDHVRIDANCVISCGAGGVRIGSFVHISVGVAILGSGGLVMEDFTGLSAHVCVFSSTDDYIGGAMTNPTVPSALRNVKDAPVILRRHAVVGAGSVVLPGVELGVGAAIGALTVVRKSVPAFAIAAGNPMRIVGKRGRDMLEHEDEVRAQNRS
jgi:acetyltransferase-like isoleucine patch superfamily enzyme